MSVTFTKLFTSITESTVWCEPDRTRLVWITMLAMADSRGRVWASVPGLANRARVPLEDAQTAVETFLSPDRHSRTPEFEGRRIEPMDGGWRLLNHGKYRAIRDEESIKESKRRYINARRAKEREEMSTVELSRANAEADTEAEKDKNKRLAPAAQVVEGVPPDLLTEWKGVRAAKRAGKITPTVIAALHREASKAGFTPEQAVRECVERGWAGFKADWLQRPKDGKTFRQKDAEDAADFAYRNSGGLMGKKKDEGLVIEMETEHAHPRIN